MRPLPSADSDSSSRRHFLTTLGLGAAAAFLAPVLRAAESVAPPKPQNAISADEALRRLMAGNQRYVRGISKRGSFLPERPALARGQNPFAAVLSCSDSRVAPEFAFDTGRGDLFVVRVAGNFVSDEGLASLEFTTAVLGTPLIVVLGHDSCGAVDAAIKVYEQDAELPGHLPGLVRHLKPAVKASADVPGDRLDNAIVANVRENVARLRKASPVLDKLVAQRKVKVVGAVYRLKTGRVEFLS